MKILGIESSAKAASVCIWEDGRLLGELFSNNGLTHSKTVLLMVEHLLRESAISLDEIEKIAIAHGPGSFTGLRIGAAVVKGLSWSRDIPCVGVSTLEATAQNARAMSGLICPVMDARAGQVYNALFKSSGGIIERVCPDRAITIAELGEQIKNEEKVILLGDGARLVYEKLGFANLCVVPENIMYPRAWGVCESANGIDAHDAQTLSLSYLRLPQAERERLAKKGEK